MHQSVASALQFVNWSAETSILAQVAGSLVGFVLVFFSIIYVKKPEKSRPLDADHRNSLLFMIASTCWTALSAAILLSIATGAVPQAVDGVPVHLGIQSYTWFTTAAATGCMSFAVCVAQTFTCLVMILSIAIGSKRVAAFSWVIMAGVTLEAIFEVATTAAQARMVKYGLYYVAPPDSMFAHSFKYIMSTFLIVATVRFIVHNPQLVDRFPTLRPYVLKVDAFLLAFGAVILGLCCTIVSSMMICRASEIGNLVYSRLISGLCLLFGAILGFCLPWGIPIDKYIRSKVGATGSGGHHTEKPNSGTVHLRPKPTTATVSTGGHEQPSNNTRSTAIQRKPPV